MCLCVARSVCGCVYVSRSEECVCPSESVYLRVCGSKSVCESWCVSRYVCVCCPCV